jgi:hypothetical protein
MKSSIGSSTLAILAICPILTGSALALTPFSDNFKATSLNTTRWTLENAGTGKLTQASGRLNFTVAASPTDDDYGILTLRNNRPGYNESWEIILDVANAANFGDDVGVGISIFNAADPNDNANFEFYGSGARGGFNFIGITDDRDIPSQDVRANPSVSRGSLRISFSKTTKLFTCWYDKTGPADGFKWAKLCTYSPTGSGGTRRGNWKMNAGSGSFGIKIFGYAGGRSIASGKVSMDNFVLKAAK